MQENKILYNLNINNERIEQFSTLKEAKEFLEKHPISIYFTKSLYTYDKECDCWDEVSESHVNQDFSLVTLKNKIKHINIKKGN